MQQIPSIGRQVHYVLADGQHRAATVVNCWGGTAVNLTVHLDQMNDFENKIVENVVTQYVKNGLQPSGSADLQNDTLAVGSAVNDEDTRAPGTWHWPEMVKPPETADPFKYSDRQKNGA